MFETTAELRANKTGGDATKQEYNVESGKGSPRATPRSTRRFKAEINVPTDATSSVRVTHVVKLFLHLPAATLLVGLGLLSTSPAKIRVALFSHYRLSPSRQRHTSDFF